MNTKPSFLGGIMNKCKISKSFKFEAAHSLPFLPEGHKCRSIHGHSYEVTVSFCGDIPDNGMLVDFAEISKVVNPLINLCDHQNLNDVIPFNTTSENIALWFAHKIKAKISCLYSVTVSETPTTSATVYA